MSPSPTRLRRVSGIGVTAVALAALTACGNSQADPGPAGGGSTLTQIAVQGAVTPGPSTDSPTPGATGDTQRCAPLPAPFTQIDACNAIAVTTAALTTMYSTDPTHDTSSQDAILRAVPLLSEQLVSRISAPTAGGQGNVEWQKLKDAHQKVVATVSVHRQDQSSYYTVIRKAVPASGAGPTKTLTTITASPTLTQVAGSGFRVDDINPLS